MLLYIHVPFCRKKCAYCAFYSVAAMDDGLMERYAKGVCLEMALWKERTADLGISSPLSGIFFGGGTPSLLPPAFVGRFLDEAAGHFSFEADIEVTLEANPESAVRKDWFRGVRTAGANRISLGAQSFFDHDLSFLGRLHSAEQTARAVEQARAAGFSNLSLDLMWGLPQTGEREVDHAKHWLAVLQQAVALSPEHISAYALTLEEDTPLARMLEPEDRRLPSEEDEKRMYLEGAAFLERSGYLQYEVSNFCRRGMACRHNTGYWEGMDYMGVGPSAVGTLTFQPPASHSPQFSGVLQPTAAIRFTNPADIAAWERAVLSGKAVGAKEPLSPVTLRMERLMLSLRTAKGLDFSLWEQQGGTALSSACPKLLDALTAGGLARLEESRLTLTREGLLVSNAVISRFFEVEGLFGKEEG